MNNLKHNISICYYFNVLKIPFPKSQKKLHKLSMPQILTISQYVVTFDDCTLHILSIMSPLEK